MDVLVRVDWRGLAIRLSDPDDIYESGLDLPESFNRYVHPAITALVNMGGGSMYLPDVHLEDDVS